MNIPCLSLLGLSLLIIRLETTEVSAWVPALRSNFPHAAARPRRPNNVITVYSTVEDSTETSTEAPPADTRQQAISVSMPKIEYTVPGMKRGWKENGVWMDEDGPRNGPPQNFWRQMGDERLHDTNIDLIQDLLKLNSLEANVVGNGASLSCDQTDSSIFRNDMLNEMISRLERTNSIRIPTLNRLILGDWAPIVRGGKVVATTTTDEEKSADIPYRFNVQRTAGQKLAPKTNYGIFDEHLEPGEEITVQELSTSNTVTASGVVEVSPEKDENKLVEGYKNAIDGDLYIGGITYVTKYIMIMRQQVQQEETEDGKQVTKGPITEIWMRIDQ